MQTESDYEEDQRRAFGKAVGKVMDQYGLNFFEAAQKMLLQNQLMIALIDSMYRFLALHAIPYSAATASRKQVYSLVDALDILGLKGEMAYPDLQQMLQNVCVLASLPKLEDWCVTKAQLDGIVEAAQIAAKNDDLPWPPRSEMPARR